MENRFETSLGPEDVEPGRMRSVIAGGFEVLLANVGGYLFAINNVCTHRQCPLTAGELEGRTVTCACHGSRFDVMTGKVVRGPAVRDAQTYEVSVANGRIAVEFRGKAA